MIQEIIILLIFLAAIGYLGRLTFKSFTSNKCESGCGKCSVDFGKVEKQIEEKGI